MTIKGTIFEDIDSLYLLKAFSCTIWTVSASLRQKEISMCDHNNRIALDVIDENKVSLMSVFLLY